MRRSSLFVFLSAAAFLTVGASRAHATPGVEMMGTYDGPGTVGDVKLLQPRGAGESFTPVSNLSSQSGLSLAAQGVTFSLDNHEETQIIAWTPYAIQHAIRHQNGTFTAWGNVLGQTGPIPNNGNARKVAICTSNGGMNVLLLTYQGQLFHSLRSDATGGWTRWGDVLGVAGNRGFVRDVACATNSGSGMQVGIVTSDGRVWHSIRDAATGNWTPFGDVIAAAGGGVSGATNIGMAQDGDANMQLMVATSSGALWHTIRNQFNGSWQPWGWVFGQTGSIALSGVNEISGAAGEFGEVEWVVDNNGQPYWTTRDVDGTWTAFQNLLPSLNVAGQFLTFHLGFVFP